MFKATWFRQRRSSTTLRCVTHRTASATLHSAITNSTTATSSGSSQAVPIAIAGALTRKTYYFVPLALSDRRAGEATLVAPAYTPELGDQAICHRNVTHDGTEGVFISTRLLGDRFALAFEFFINVGHAFVDVIGYPRASTSLSGARPSPTSAAKPARTPGRAAPSLSAANQTRSTANP